MHASLALLLLAAAPLAAQQESPDSARVGELRRRIEDRFAARVQEELGLTDAQTAKMKATGSTYFTKRRGYEADERRLRAALAGQLRPGVAANQDSVSRLTDGLLDLKFKYVQSYRDELKEMSSYLSPVQRAQFFIMRERLLERVREARRAREGEEGGPGPWRPRRRQQ
ncbi:MAG: Spy/CpxP family protein refolding chaperone [Gemmatimonadales bacterium]